jgi:hypothetical protein
MLSEMDRGCILWGNKGKFNFNAAMLHYTVISKVKLLTVSKLQLLYYNRHNTTISRSLPSFGSATCFSYQYPSSGKYINY